MESIRNSIERMALIGSLAPDEDIPSPFMFCRRDFKSLTSRSYILVDSLCENERPEGGVLPAELSFGGNGGSERVEDFLVARFLAIVSFRVAHHIQDGRHSFGGRRSGPS